ncbi:hypothetical protein ST47_g7935 [Ascochyta rabiei]|uniref:Uncharacterized protein n=2 Tax=Didymella rabiei TaxID=5454 RepID=A0A163A099_DIDRA|nr:hypothetical protein ST47_g7935 [Ascochyta rabiei]
MQQDHGTMSHSNLCSSSSGVKGKRKADVDPEVQASLYVNHPANGTADTDYAEEETSTDQTTSTHTEGSGDAQGRSDATLQTDGARDEEQSHKQLKRFQEVENARPAASSNNGNRKEGWRRQEPVR